MNKLKASLILLLTLFVLLTGAFFPKIVSIIQDQRLNGSTSSIPITAVELKIKKDISPVARLIMLSNAVSFTEVTENITAMTKEAALEAARTGLSPYIEAGLMMYWEDEITLTPALVQTSSMQELQGIVWFVHIKGDAGGISNINIIIDDDTGHILQIEYTHKDLTNVIPTGDAVNMWADIFFSALEVDYLSAKTETEQVYDHTDHTTVQYAFHDSEYGQVLVNLILYPYGFIIECVQQ